MARPTRNHGAAVLAALLLCAAPANAAGKFPIGDWYGEGQPGDPNYHWLAHYKPGGVFEIVFRHCISGKALDDNEGGTWSYENGRDRISTLHIEGEATHYVDDYETISNTGRVWKYRMVASLNADAPIGFVFTAVRVDASFVLPQCDMSS
ncbi:MAG TPA: hypothetical protein VN932_12975 [Rhizomicrobium sp.]|nr:hypothetical protein [Rhizomicrobium sp.]